MGYSQGSRDYRAYQTSTSARNVPSDTDSSLSRRLFVIVALLGLASYGFSFGPVVNGGGAIGWYVRFATLAALCAGFGLLATQKPLPPLLAAVLAAMGFLDGLSNVVTAEVDWAMTVIVVLNAAQAVTAIVALLVWPKGIGDGTGSPDYQAYVDYYNQAVRHYYSQQAPAMSTESSQDAGYGQATSEARAAPSGYRTQRPSQYGDYADYVGQSYDEAPHGDSRAAASQPARPAESAPPGLLSSRRAHVSGGQQERHADESGHPSSP